MSKRKNVSAMVRDVADNQAEYTIERGGMPVAVIVPVDKLRAMQEAAK